jgi:CheY-like chemotaxis protein
MDAQHWQPRDEAERIHAQVAALERWNRTQHLGDAAVRTSQLTREARLDLARRTEARRREQQALMSRAEEQLRVGRSLLAPATAVVAHRNAWFRDKVTQGLSLHGVEVTASIDDGADASAAIILDQPDLVLVEDLLPTLTGLQVIARAREYSPGAFVAAQVAASDEVARLLECGAQAVFTRRIPPAVVADRLVKCLHSRQESVTVL